MSRKYSNIFENIQKGTVTENGLSVSIEKPQVLLTMMSERFRSKPIFILVSGTSESGKSHLGKHFVKSETGNRLKFYKTLAGTSEYGDYNTSNSKKNPFDFAESIKNKSKIKNEVFNKIKEDYICIIRKTNIPVATVETIKHPWIIEAFRSDSDLRVLCLFIDAPVEERVKREARKTKHGIEEIMDKTLEKDTWKNSFGNQEIRSMADLLINNAGGTDVYNSFLDSFELFLRNSSKKYIGSPLDFS